MIFSVHRRHLNYLEIETVVKKLFQHVVVEAEVKGSVEKIKAETMKIFKSGGHFEGLSKEYKPLSDSGDPLPREDKQVVTTVPARLDWTRAPFVALFDYEITRDATNQIAKADLIVHSETIAFSVPSSSLLTFEKQLRSVREYYDAIPTLDLAAKWEKSSGQENVWQAGPDLTYRTRKESKAVVLYEATKEHPAQVKEVVSDVTIGTFKSMSFSGKIHPRDKADYLTRIDELIEAVKDARMRANDIQVIESKIGDALFDFIHG